MLAWLTFIKLNVKLAVVSATRYPPESFELVAAEGIKPDVPCGVLDKPCFVTKPVVAVFPHTVEMSLMLSVVATCKSTIFIEPAKPDLVLLR